LISHGNRPPRGGLLPRLDPRAEALRIRDRYTNPRTSKPFAKQQGLLVARFYRDEAVASVQSSSPRSTACPSLDRLSRDVRIAENLFHEFATVGVDVLIADIRRTTAVTAKISWCGRSWRLSPRKTGRRSSSGCGRPGKNGCDAACLLTATSPTASGGTEKYSRSIRQREGCQYNLRAAARGQNATTVARCLNPDRLVPRNGQPWTLRQVAAALARSAFYHTGVVRCGVVNGLNEGIALFRRSGR
jgi:hypothetical protein